MKIYKTLFLYLSQMYSMNPDLELQIFELKREDTEKNELTGRVQTPLFGLVEREVQKLMF